MSNGKAVSALDHEEKLSPPEKKHKGMSNNARCDEAGQFTSVNLMYRYRLKS